MIDQPIGTMVWQIPQRGTGQQTMLYVCTFPGDPHAEFERSLTDTPKRQILAARVWLALNLPLLLAISGTLLGVSLVAAPVAYAAELRLEGRSRAEAEFARVRRDAHDRVYNRLTALSQRADEAAQKMPPDARGSFGCVGEDIRRTVADLQGILGEGEAAAEERSDASLAAQLEAVSVAQASLHGIEVAFEAAGDIRDVPARLGWDLQCVLEEAITNAVKHGRANRVTVKLGTGAGGLALTVADDGSGPADAGANGRASTGLAGMRARLGAWGGTVELARGESGAVLTVGVDVAR